MIPLSFGATLSRSFNQASTLKQSPASDSSTRNSVRFGGGNDPQITNYHELGHKGLYRMPSALVDWLDRQQNPSRVRTLDDIAEKDWQERYRNSSVGQEYLNAVLESRARDLSRSNISPYRTALVKLLSKDHPNISDEELLRRGVTDVVKNNPGITNKELVDFISKLFMYEKDPSFASPGTRLGHEGDPAAHPPLVIDEKPSVAHEEAKAAWNRAIYAWDRKTNIKLRQPKSTILDHAALLEAVITHRNASRTPRTRITDLPLSTSESLLRGISAQNPPSWIYQLGLRGSMNDIFQRFQSNFRIVRLILQKETPFAEANRALELTHNPSIPLILSPHSSFKIVPAPISPENPDTKGVTDVTPSKLMSSNPRRTHNTPKIPALNRSASTTIILESPEQQHEPVTRSFLPSIASFKVSSPSDPQKSSVVKSPKDFNSSKPNNRRSHRIVITLKPRLIQSTSEPIRQDNGKGASKLSGLPRHKTFSGYLHL
jgi:hypothetical protein